jgi:hypothetical protein
LELRSNHRANPLIVGIDAGLIIEHADLHSFHLRGSGAKRAAEQKKSWKKQPSYHVFLLSRLYRHGSARMQATRVATTGSGCSGKSGLPRAQ